MTGSRPASPTISAASASAASDGGRFTLRRHGRSVLNAPSTTFSSAAACSGSRAVRSAPCGREPMRRDDHTRRRDDVDRVGAEPPPHDHFGADEAGRDRVAVAPHAHQRVRRHDPRRPRPWPGYACSGSASSGSRSASSPTVASPRGRASATRDAELSRLACASVGLSDAGGAPPPLGEEVDRSSRPRLCGCRAGPGTDRPRRRNASRPARTIAWT